MARELAMNPKKLGKIDNHRQQPWKLPLPEFIENLYWKRFGKERPDVVLSIEEKFQRDLEKRAKKHELKMEHSATKAAEAAEAQAPPANDSTAADPSR